MSTKRLFVGFAVSEETMNEICKLDQRPQIAAHKLQWNIIQGIEMASSHPIDLISSLPVTDYPLFPRIFIDASQWKHREDCDDLTIFFINLPILKHITRLISCFIPVMTWLMRNKQYKKRQIIVYALHSPHVLAVLAATRLLGGNVILMIPDLPAYMDQSLSRNLIRKLLKPIDGFLLMKLIRQAKGLIVLTKQMAQDFAPGVPSLVVEGSLSFDDIDKPLYRDFPKIKSESKEKIIMYAGNLSEAYGIPLLLDGFRIISNENYRLWIFGKGDMVPEILLASSHDKRVVYGGFISYDEFIQTALHATVLVNPRYSNVEYTGYSFPSKVLEYMKTGCPTITTVLPGIPEEYYDYVYLLKVETPKALAALLVEVCSKDTDELKHFGRIAREFVLKNKNSLRQGQRIYEFLEKL